MEGALEGHPGILTVRFDIDAERFDIHYDPEEVSAEVILRVVEELGYDPEIVSAQAEASLDQAKRVDLAGLPGEFEALFDEARRAARPVLLDFTAPG